MAADPSAAELARKADEFDDRTYLFLYRDQAGRWVRDAKFIVDTSPLEVADAVFAGHVDAAEVRLCAVLRGQVRTVDQFTYADEPDPVGDDGWLYQAEAYDREARRSYFTVYGCWDTGDGPRRYSRQVAAFDATHAELLTRLEVAAGGGEFLVAGVVDGCIPVEDTDAVWATVDGQPPAPERPSWWQRLRARLSSGPR